VPLGPGAPPEREFYYLHNFCFALDWIAERHGDLCGPQELGFMAAFRGLPRASQALLVRLLMRAGPVFRVARLEYPEIGCPSAALGPLLEQGFLESDPVLGLGQVFRLFRREELRGLFRGEMATLPARETKVSWFERLQERWSEPRRWSVWLSDLRRPVDIPVTGTGLAVDRWGVAHEIGAGLAVGAGLAAPRPEGRTDDANLAVVEVRVAELVERLRLMFFGNLRQGWSEFVLADLGVFRYEAVDFPASARAFACRDDVDTYLRIHRLRERLEAGDDWREIHDAAAAEAPRNAWLAQRRDKLLFLLGRYRERAQAWADAERVYSDCGYAGARHRLARVLERSGRLDEAGALARQAMAEPQDDAELQLMTRLLDRVRRALAGQTAATSFEADLHAIDSRAHPGTNLHAPTLRARPDASRVTFPLKHLTLPRPVPFVSVELAARDAYAEPGSTVHYVENLLVNALFGLLCWPAIFHAVPGAFFHPYQRGPADLMSRDFVRIRQALFDACLGQLDDGRHVDAIMTTYGQKAGIQSPFVGWGGLDEDLLRLALACIPPTHLRLWCGRLMADLNANRAGWPDLIMFRPESRSYRLIEIKGPGDRLQDNQRRTLAFLLQHDMPVEVCHVTWLERES
jgi:hypothetical protein